MTWVRLDEEFPAHPKVLKAGPLAMAMQVAALCYCNRFLTDGFVPREVAAQLLTLDGIAIECWSSSVGFGGGQDATWQAIVARLEEAGIWDQAEGGWRIHDFEHYQPTKAEVLELRAKKQAAGAAGGKAAQARKRATAQARAQAAGQATPQAPARASAKAKLKPVPVPVTEPETVTTTEPPKTSTASPLAPAAPREDLVAEYIDLGGPPTRAAQLGRAINALRKRGVDAGVIRNAVHAIAAEGKSPGVLDLVIRDFETGKRSGEPKGFAAIRRAREARERGLS